MNGSEVMTTGFFFLKEDACLNQTLLFLKKESLIVWFGNNELMKSLSMHLSYIANYNFSKYCDTVIQIVKPAKV